MERDLVISQTPSVFRCSMGLARYHYFNFIKIITLERAAVHEIFSGAWMHYYWC